MQAVVRFHPSYGLSIYNGVSKIYSDSMHICLSGLARPRWQHRAGDCWLLLHGLLHP